MKAVFWTGDDENGVRAPYLACLAQDLEASPASESVNNAFLDLHEGEGLFYFIDTDGGFRIAHEGDGATCTLVLHDGTALLQFVVPPAWATLAIETGGAMMVIVGGDADLSRVRERPFEALVNEPDVEVLSFCAVAAR